MIHLKSYSLFESQDAKDFVWYHGTDSKFDTFDMSKTKTGPSAFGLWFTDDPELSKMFGENVIKCELSYKKPKVITMDQWDKIRVSHAKDTEYFKNWKSKLISDGYDALFIKERTSKFAGQIVRDGNIVTVFDQNDADIIKESIDTDNMYHVSLSQNRISILRDGLLPGGGPTPWPEDEYPEGIYLFDNIKSARSYGFGNGDPFDIWEVSVSDYPVNDDPITKGAFYISESVSKTDIKLIEKHESDVTNPINESIGSGSLILMSGAEQADGSRRLYAVPIKKLSSYDRKKTDNTEAQAAKMATLGNDFYRLSIKDGHLIANKVSFSNKSTMFDTLGLDKSAGQPNVVLNADTGKTPLHWIALKFNNVNKMIREFGTSIMSIPGIRWSN